MRPCVTSLCAVTAGAALMALAPPAWSQPTTADPAKIEEAKKHMAAGAAFYNDPSGHKCEEAIREFGKAYELSGSLNALKGMAVCNLELEHDGEAIEQYTKFLQGKGSAIDPAEKQQVEADLTALKAGVAFVTLNTDHAGVKITDVRTPSRGFPITNRYDLPLAGKKYGLHPGSHTLTASAEGLPDQTWKIDITNGGKYDHSFDFDKGKPVTAEGFTKKDLGGGGAGGDEPDKVKPTRPIPPAAIALGVVTVAGAGATAGLGVWALGKNSTYKDANGKQPAATLNTLRDDVKTANLITDIALGVTLASAVTTVVLIATRPTKKVQPKAASFSVGRGSAVPFSVSPSIGQAGGGAFVTGAF